MKLVSKIDVLFLQLVSTFSSRGSRPCFDNWLFESYGIRFDTTTRVNISSHIESHRGVWYGVCGSHVSRYLLCFCLSYIVRLYLYCLINIAITLMQSQEALMWKGVSLLLLKASTPVYCCDYQRFLIDEDH